MTGVNFLWHMHQPDYRPAGGMQAILPWVRLHAVRGYLDLLAVLEQHPEAHCTVNFSGILLEQLLTYDEQHRDYFAELSLREADELTAEEAAFVLAQFFSANAQTLIRPHERYWQLLQKCEELRGGHSYEELAARFSPQELTDLLVWFNLAWVGFTGAKEPEVCALVRKGRDFTADDQRAVLAVHEQIISAVLSRYRKLAESGAIELSFTPYHHPILPLLLDCAGEGHLDPADPLPQFSYPADAAEQVRRGMECYQRAFGRPPTGAWPAEGSVSDAALAVLADAGVRWAATDQQNLPAAERLGHLTPWQWQRDGRSMLMFFRDTRLADNVGFEYATWKPLAAAEHLAENIAALGRQAEHAHPVVSVILDGENPWEAYPDGGEAFLHALCGQFIKHPELEPTTPSRLLAQFEFPQLEHVKSGSWIMGNFDIWSKDREARAAWRLLARTRADLANAIDETVLAELLAAEGSDWFWWYGDTFQSDQKPQFDELFRGHLIAAYEAAGQSVPPELYTPILSSGVTAAALEVWGLIDPVIDGRVSSYFEWLGAVDVESGLGQSAMAASAPGGIRNVKYGFSERSFYLRVELSAEQRKQMDVGEPKLKICMAQNGTEQCVRFTAKPGRRRSTFGRFALRDFIEVEIPLGNFRLRRGEAAWFWIELESGADTPRFPAAGRVPFMVLPEDFAARNWIV